jgi:hypothetical protein
MNHNFVHGKEREINNEETMKIRQVLAELTSSFVDVELQTYFKPLISFVKEATALLRKNQAASINIGI